MIFYKRLAAIKAMTFDLDDTFYDNHPYIRKAEQQLFDYLFQRYPALADLGVDGWRAARQQVLSDAPILKHDMIRLRKQVLECLFKTITMSPDEIPEAVQAAFDFFYDKRSNFTVNPEYQQLLNWLSQRIPLVAITNGNVDLERIGIAQYFVTSLHASVEQPMKPHPKMFKLAQEELNIPENNILHIGDNLRKDVAGAIQAGFQAAWYAENRKMDLSTEKATLLPHVRLDNLQQLRSLLTS